MVEQLEIQLTDHIHVSLNYLWLSAALGVALPSWLFFENGLQGRWLVLRSYNNILPGGTTNSISWGSTNQVDSGARQNVGLTYDTNVDRIVVQWTDSGNSSYGTAIVGTVTGGTTNSISFGSDSVYESANSYTSNNNEGIAFDSNTNKIVIILVIIILTW